VETTGAFRLRSASETLTDSDMPNKKKI